MLFIDYFKTLEAIMKVVIEADRNAQHPAKHLRCSVS